MILAVDVDYRDARARVASFLFREWGDAQAAADRAAERVVTNDYLPGEFFTSDQNVKDHAALLRDMLDNKQNSGPTPAHLHGTYNKNNRHEAGCTSHLKMNGGYGWTLLSALSHAMTGPLPGHSIQPFTRGFGNGRNGRMRYPAFH